MEDQRLKSLLLRAAAAAMAAALGYAALRWLLVWLLPFLIAAAAAAAMEPAVAALQRRPGLRRGFASLVVTLFALFLLGGLLSLLGSVLSAEAGALLDRGGALLSAAPEALAAALRRARRYSAACPPWLREQAEAAISRAAAWTEGLLSQLLDRLPGYFASLAAALPGVVLGVVTTVLAAYFTSASAPELKALFRRLPPRWQRGAVALGKRLSASLGRYLRSELTLCAVTFGELFAAFLFLRQPCGLLLSLLITLVDALPVFGAGTVLVPWALSELLTGNLPKAAVLAALYLVALTVRATLEPRLLGRQAGLPPVLSLLAMYLGCCVMGIRGMVLFPLLLIFAAYGIDGEKRAP